MEIYQEIFERLKTRLQASRKGVFTDNPKNFAQRQILKEFDQLEETLQEWQDLTGFSDISIHDERNNKDYDMFVGVLGSRTGIDKRRPNNPIPVMIFAVDQDQQITLRLGNAHKTIIKDDGTIDEKSLTGVIQNPHTYFYKETFRPKINQDDGLDNIDRFFRVHSHSLVNKIRGLIRKKCIELKFGQYTDIIEQEAYSIATAVLNERYYSQLEEFFDAHYERKNFNRDDYEFVKTLGYRLSKETHFDIYNHLQRAPNEQAKYYRKNALTIMNNSVFQKSPFFLKKDEIWESIDQGTSPYQAIADYCGVKPFTIKEMFKKCDWISPNASIKNMAFFLDKINPDFWPTSKTPKEVSYFIELTIMARKFAEAFDCDADETLRSWVYDSRKETLDDGQKKPRYRKLKSWREVFEYITKNQVTYHSNMKLCDFAQDQILRNALSKKHESSQTLLKDMDPEFIERTFQDEGMITALRDRWIQDIDNIKDMKSEIKRKILSPLIVLSLKQAGWAVTDSQAIEENVSEANKRLWAGMSPGDQIRASNYWHSDRVNIQGRFTSAVLSTDETYNQWEPLFLEEYYEASNGVRIYPLTSSEALRHEGSKEVMRHCIASYSTHHYTQNYHMFSVRDKNGKRLTTLSVQDFEDGDKGKQIKKQHNLGYRNAKASTESQTAVTEFIGEYNKGNMETDWAKIEKQRAQYKANQIENAAGYDINDPEQRQSVFEVYIPCLPKAIVRASEASFDGLKEALSIDKLFGSIVFEENDGLMRAPFPPPINDGGNVQHRHIG